MTAAVAAEEPPPDPVPHLTRKLQMLAEASPDIYRQIFEAKEPTNGT